MPSLIRFGGGPDPYVHPLVLCAMLAAGALILLLPRRQVIVPLLAASLLIPFDQVVLIVATTLELLTNGATILLPAAESVPGADVPVPAAEHRP